MTKKGHIAIFLATSGHSGVERVMGNLIKGLGEAGHRVDLIRIKKHGPYLTEVPQNVRIIELNTSHVTSALPFLIKYLKKNRPHSLLTDKDRVNRIAILSKYISRSPVRLVVRIGTTVTENLRKRSAFDRSLQLFSIRHLYPLADRILVPSKGAQKDLIDIAPGLSEKISVVKSPIIDDDFHLRANSIPDHPWFKGKSCPIVLGAGELCRRKDFETLIKAFSLVLKEIDARLIILGKGKRRKKLLSLSSELGISDKIDLPGFMKNPLPFMANADCFCLTSRCEGLPVVLIEALGTGTSVVSTDCPSGPREILGGGKYGRLVKIGDVEGLRDAIIDTLKNPIAPEKLKQAVDRYTIHSGTRDYARWLLPV
ncbi:Alpha-1,4-N-acetylgalactosamine transferase PglJ [Dissulfuribacter thermophilus]|uniref:Alpha-1,4-N-acetylgalactosamine transferase PglJ n=1 Tax=Dissulfuribacter thermophilus TaxID=1156395 RepID=A0A1B9F5D7_9BACT|nr:glycosyltransferase [Dissulfuribacter thermophilus]OCC15025.1 Alpha-1,4-N-acetylgalactosamine transferase PglJ [Dissulfuribacter thermophilus]